MREFDHQLLRLKQALGMVEDQAVAAALGISLISWDVEQLERAGPVVRMFRPDEMAG